MVKRKTVKHQYYFEEGVSRNLKELSKLDGVSEKIWLTTHIQSEAKSRLPKKKADQEPFIPQDPTIMSILPEDEAKYDLTHLPITDEEFKSISTENKSRYRDLEQTVLEKVMALDPDEEIPDSFDGVHFSELSGIRLRKFIFISAMRMGIPIPELYKKAKKKRKAVKRK